MLKRLFLFALLIFPVQVSAQNFLNEKRIYLVDVTASMKGKGAVATPDIFDAVKQQLCQSIDDLNDKSTEVVIIPFTDRAHDVIRGTVQGKDSLMNALNNVAIKKGDTNIVDAWDSGLGELDSTKVNYLFLLTDGLHNCGPEVDSLYSKISSWSDVSAGKYMFAFYVMLTPYAKDTEIVRIIENTRQIWSVESMNVNVSFICTSVNLSANVNHGDPVKLVFTSNNLKIFDESIDIAIRLEDNPYYKIKSYDIDLVNKVAVFSMEELVSRMQIPVDVDLSLYIKYDKGKYPLVFFTPEEIDFHIVNRGLRTMTIKER